MNMYNPKDHWNQIGNVSAVGSGDHAGRFGIDRKGDSLYKLPPWNSPPQFWSYVQKGCRVLDIGSGIGLEVGRLTNHGFFAVGCDISPVLLEVARRNCEVHGIARPMFVQWDGLKLPFENHAFDAVFTNTVLQHVVDDDALKTIFREVSNVVRPGGRFIISELVSPLTIQTAPHVKLRSLRQYERIALESSLRVKEVYREASIYASVQALYGFLKNLKISSHEKEGQSILQPHPSGSRHVSAIGICKVLMQAFSKVGDPVLHLMRLDPAMVSQVTIVFEKIAP